MEEPDFFLQIDFSQTELNFALAFVHGVSTVTIFQWGKVSIQYGVNAFT